MKFRKFLYWDAHYYVFTNDLSFVMGKLEICSFAYDNTSYLRGANLAAVLKNLEHDGSKFLNWFKVNYRRIK